MPTTFLKQLRKSAFNETSILPFFLAGDFKHFSFILKPSSNNNCSQVSRTHRNASSHTHLYWQIWILLPISVYLQTVKHYAQRWKFQLSSPQKHEIRSNQQAVEQSFIITPLQQSVSVWCKADLPLDLSSTWLSVPPLAFSLTSLCPSPHLSIHHLGGQRKSINPSTPSFTPLDWWEGGQEMGEPWIFHNIFVALEKKNCIALHQTYAHTLRATLG